MLFRSLFNLTNMTYNVGQTTREELVSVPIRGLFNLTWFWRWCLGVLKRRVSVPIRGLFNLTLPLVDKLYTCDVDEVSVPIRGLFNLTGVEV